MSENNMGIPEKLIDLLGRFIYRDYFYFVSGAIIFLNFAYVISVSEGGIDHSSILKSIPDSLSILIAWVSVGLLHAIGFVNQEIWSQTPVVTTRTSETYCKIQINTYKRHRQLYT